MSKTLIFMLIATISLIIVSCTTPPKISRFQYAKWIDIPSEQDKLVKEAGYSKSAIGTSKSPAVDMCKMGARADSLANLMAQDVKKEKKEIKMTDGTTKVVETITSSTSGMVMGGRTLAFHSVQIEQRMYECWMLSGQK